jgi:hypothetical protein
MKSSTLPMTCGVALAAMSAAGFSHWWSVNSFVAAVHTGLPLPVAAPPAAEPVETPAPEPAPAATLAARAAKPAATPDEAVQKKFYESLIAKMEAIQNQNRDLLDQVAETNRDVMKLEFRVDTHSESFRPMPVNEERIDMTFEDGPGVLPPRVEPVLLPMGE